MVWDVMPFEAFRDTAGLSGWECFVGVEIALH